MTEVEFAEPTCHILFLTRHLTDRLHGRRAQCPSATPRSARRRASPTSSQARPRFPRLQGSGAARTGPPDRSPAGGRRAGGLCLLRVADRRHEACRDPPEVPDAAGAPTATVRTIRCPQHLCDCERRTMKPTLKPSFKVVRLAHGGCRRSSRARCPSSTTRPASSPSSSRARQSTPSSSAPSPRGAHLVAPPGHCSRSRPFLAPRKQPLTGRR